MKKFVYKTNACKNCCVTGHAMSKHITYLENLCLRYEEELSFYKDKRDLELEMLQKALKSVKKVIAKI